MNRDGATRSICEYRLKALDNIETLYFKLKKGETLKVEEDDSDSD
jgi:hypothetical protein